MSASSSASEAIAEERLWGSSTLQCTSFWRVGGGIETVPQGRADANLLHIRWGHGDCVKAITPVYLASDNRAASEHPLQKG